MWRTLVGIASEHGRLTPGSCILGLHLTTTECQPQEASHSMTGDTSYHNYYNDVHFC
jgi:hypothetical protein